MTEVYKELVEIQQMIRVIKKDTDEVVKEMKEKYDNE